MTAPDLARLAAVTASEQGYFSPNQALRAARFAGIYPQVKSSCYCSILRGAARKTTALYDEALAPAGITVAQFSLLRRIEWAGAPSLTGLAGLAELDRSTVGRNVKVLERMGLVEIGPAEDQREAAVSLTAAGAEAIRNAAPLWDEAQRRVEAVLGLEGARALRGLARAL